MRRLAAALLAAMAGCVDGGSAEETCTSARRWAASMGYTVDVVNCDGAGYYIGWRRCSVRLRETAVPVSLDCRADGCTQTGGK